MSLVKPFRCAHFYSITFVEKRNVDIINTENRKLEIALNLKFIFELKVNGEIMKKQNILLLVLAIIFIFGLFNLWQYSLYQKLSKVDMSCGGDWSYNVQCPIGSYCRSLGQGPSAGGVCTPFFLSPFSVFKNWKSVDLKRCTTDLSNIVIPEEFANSIDKGYFIKFEDGDYLLYRTQNNIEKKVKMNKNYLLTDGKKKIQKEDFNNGDIVSIRLIEAFINTPEAAIITNHCIK